MTRRCQDLHDCLSKGCNIINSVWSRWWLSRKCEQDSRPTQLIPMHLILRGYSQQVCNLWETKNAWESSFDHTDEWRVDSYSPRRYLGQTIVTPPEVLTSAQYHSQFGGGGAAASLLGSTARKSHGNKRSTSCTDKHTQISCSLPMYVCEDTAPQRTLQSARYCTYLLLLKHVDERGEMCEKHYCVFRSFGLSRLVGNSGVKCSCKPKRRIAASVLDWWAHLESYITGTFRLWILRVLHSLTGSWRVCASSPWHSGGKTCSFWIRLGTICITFIVSPSIRSNQIP